jgi:hypothetical protein
VADGTRTRDHRDHNPGLYRLSYCHRALLIVAAYPGIDQARMLWAKWKRLCGSYFFLTARSRVRLAP